MDKLMATDRLIAPSERRKRLIRRIGVPALILIVCGGGLMGLTRWLSPSVQRDLIRTARVETGPVEATITASGTVVPAFEQVITSPIDTRVVRDLHRPGAPLEAGAPIVALDTGALVLSLRKNQDQIDLNRNRQRQLRLEREKTLNELRKNLEIKKLTVASNRSRAERYRKLNELGLTAADEVREHELTAKISVIELDDLEKALENTNRSVEADLEELAIQLNTLQLERLELERQLEQATPKADRRGVLTWVVSHEGTAVPRGSVVARLADLTSFRVDAAVSDIHAARMRPGMPVKVDLDGEVLTGTVANLLPTIENGVMTVEARLDTPTHPRLKSNLRVDVYLVTAHKDRALRIRRGPFITGEGMHHVFVIRHGVAVKTPVRFGLSSFEYFEVLEGLEEGDEVIISSMEAFRHLDEVKVK
jgi:HlyD family secretion protein